MGLGLPRTKCPQAREPARRRRRAAGDADTPIRTPAGQRRRLGGCGPSVLLGLAACAALLGAVWAAAGSAPGPLPTEDFLLIESVGLGLVMALLLLGRRDRR